MTERKTDPDRAALLEEKQFSERLIDCLPGIFYLYDSDLRLRRWNKNLEAASGYTAEELSGMNLCDWCRTEEERELVMSTARHLLQEGDAIDFLEMEMRRKDGSGTPYLVSGAHVDSPTGPIFVGVGIDIEARLKAEKALAASECNYRELFDATNDALVIHDESGCLLDVNARACAMFGIEPSQFKKLSINDLSLGEPPYSQREALVKLRQAMNEGPQVFDWRSRRADGSLFWSEVALRTFHFGDTREVRVIASVRDITERKLADLEHERLTREALAANSTKDQFLAVLSHELRNPLAAIQAGVGLLRCLSNLDDPRLQRGVDVIERNVKLQARLVNDLLDLSRLAGGKLAMQRAPVQLDDAVLSAVQACRADAERAEVSLDTHAESGLWVDADSDRIQQVVINLIGNGIKFTPKGGRVIVSVVVKDRHGHIVVEDTGAGIEPQLQPTIFEMFQQGQIAARRAPGLGIGLALVKSIVELHAGRVWVESEGPGRGSRFTVELPACEAPRSREAGERSGESRVPIRMLLIEDNDDARTLLAETFAELAYQVLPARSGEAALDILSHEGVDVILADIGLPGMDGYEFLRRARMLPTAASTPAVALTGYGRASDLSRARDAGYIDHVVKPVDVAVVDQRIRARLSAVHA